MVRYYNKEDYSFLENVLKEFNTNLDSIKTNPFSKILVYDDGIKKGVLIFSIYYDRAELDYIYVYSEFRKNGIASKLMEFMIKECNSVKNITLEVNVNNKGAIRLYEKYGFRIVSIREKYYGNDDAYLMIREMM